MYYVYDYSNLIGNSMSWKDSASKATIFGPNGSGSEVVPFDNGDLNGDRYFVVGCFSNSGYTGFNKIAQAMNSVTTFKCP